MTRYRFLAVATGPDDLSELARLLRLVFPDLRDPIVPYLTWLYHQNPAGEVIGINAWDGDLLAGHYAVVPIVARRGREITSAALSLNTAVHPEHRGQGLFTELGEATYEVAKERGVDHVIGIANANSTPGFLRRLSFRDLGSLSARLLWQWPAVVESEVDVSWERVWAPTHLRWRMENPSADYAMRRHRGVRFLLAPTGRMGIHAILKAEREAGEIALAGATLRASGRLRPLLWLGRSRRIRPRFLGSVEIPRSLRPSPLNVIYRGLRDAKDVPDPARIEFETIDFDAY